MMKFSIVFFAAMQVVFSARAATASCAGLTSGSSVAEDLAQDLYEKESTMLASFRSVERSLGREMFGTRPKIDLSTKGVECNLEVLSKEQFRDLEGRAYSKALLVDTRGSRRALRFKLAATEDIDTVLALFRGSQNRSFLATLRTLGVNRVFIEVRTPGQGMILTEVDVFKPEFSVTNDFFRRRSKAKLFIGEDTHYLSYDGILRRLTTP